MRAFLLCLILNTLFLCPALADTANILPEYVEGDVLVLIAAPTYEEGISRDVYAQLVLEQAEAFASKYGLRVIRTYPEIAKISGESILFLRSDHKSTDDLIKELSSDPNVIGVQPNYIEPAPDYPLPIIPPDPNDQTSQDTDNSIPSQQGGGCNAGYGSILSMLVGFTLLAIHRRNLM